MFKNLARILSCVCILGTCGAMDKKDIEVDNPVPLLIQEVAPGFLQGDHYTKVYESFEKSASGFAEKCVEAMKLPGFPKRLNNTWQEKLALLKNTYNALKEKKDFTQIHQELVDVTENGFFTDSKVTIYGTENSEELDGVLDAFWQCLWQARELTEYFVILSKQHVFSSEIPEICEALDKSINYIRRFAILEKTKQEKEALRIEAHLNSILSAYQYMEFGRAVKTNENIKSMEEIFANEKLKSIMVSAFDSTE